MRECFGTPVRGPSALLTGQQPASLGQDRNEVVRSRVLGKVPFLDILSESHISKNVYVDLVCVVPVNWSLPLFGHIVDLK